MKDSLLIRISRLLPDKQYFSLKFYKEFGRFLNWKSPQTFSEELQWLKLYDRKPEYTRMVDKYAVKIYVNIIGEKYVIPTLGVWSSPPRHRESFRKCRCEVINMYYSKGDNVELKVS